MFFYNPGMTLAQLEKETIIAALQFYNGNKTHTASALGITTKTIQNKLNLYFPKEKEVKPEDTKSQPDKEVKSDT